MRRLAWAICVSILPVCAFAQVDDRDYLTAFLEDSLSGAGRKVSVTGFEDALSSAAHLQALTIADSEGVWLTLRDVTLDWNRSALLSGQLSVNRLTAAEIFLARMPVPESGLPSAEAAGFALPELPVSVEIGTLTGERVVLGAAVLGRAVEARVAATVSLIGGEGRASLSIARIDGGPEGRLSLAASYQGAGQLLSVDLDAREAAGGIVAGLLGIPGQPSTALTVKGAGPLTDFAAAITLQTDGATRLAGRVRLLGQPDGGTGFDADLAGDLAPAFLPQYADFLGSEVGFKTSGKRWADGRLELSDLAVTAGALQLNGQLALAADGVPEHFDLTGTLGQATGKPVLLPLPTAVPTRVESASLDLHFDAGSGESWALEAKVLGLTRPDLAVARLGLRGSGRIARTGGVPLFTAALAYLAEGLAPQDAGLARALGDRVSGALEAHWRDGDDRLTLPHFAVSGADYSAQASGTISGLGNALTLTGRLEADMADLSRLSRLAARPLAGSARVVISGSGSPLSGAFDLEAAIDGHDLKAGLPELDGLLRGAARVTAMVRRDGDGVEVRRLRVAAASASADLTGRIASAGSTLTGTISFTDLGALGPGYRGAFEAKAQFDGTRDDGRLTMELVARDLAVGQPEVDTLLRGESQASLALLIGADAVRIDAASLRNPQLAVQATGTVAGASRRVDLSAQLTNLAVLLPEFSGPLRLSGQAVQDPSGTTLDLAVKGPGQINAVLKGKLAPDFGTGALSISGTAQAALANAFIGSRSVSGGVRFDLRLDGPLRLTGLSGEVALSNGRIADPAQNFALQNVALEAKLAGGRAALVARAEVSTGGHVAMTGSLGLAAPFVGDLALDVQQVTLRDRDLYQTSASGALKIAGPLSGGAMVSGRVALSETELRVPSSGFGGAGTLPDLRHKNEPGAVRATRGRAGLVADAKTAGAGGAAFGLDVTVSAPNRLFVRGRGLDVEMGGELRLLGSTAAVKPVGSFALIRGRLDILGKRLDLSEASLQLEGEMVPFLRIVASTENDGIESAVVIDGPATEPVVSFTSSPELPEEEVLAQLLFGQSLLNLSALQAIQMAGAVATLAGRGGDGIVGNLRKKIGLDNLDIKTAADGTATVTAGKYLARKVYSEVEIDQAGKSRISLKLDISPSITLQGRAGSDGDTGLGLFVEKDY